MDEGGREFVIKDSNLLESIRNGDDDEVSRCWQFKKMRIRFSDIEIQEQPLVKLDFYWHAFSRSEHSQFRQTLAWTEHNNTVNSHMPETSANGEKVIFKRRRTFQLTVEKCLHK